MKVLLLGDSIRLSYRKRVQELLAGRAEIQGPDANASFSAYTLFWLSAWAPDDDYDIVHWNNGQWDTCYMPDGRIHTPLPVYLDEQKRIAEILRRKARRLIFATTTPVWPNQFETTAVRGRKNEDIAAYNRAVTDMLGRLGVAINDLNTAVSRDIHQYIVGEDKVHLSPPGVELCAGLVSEALMKPH